MVPQLERLGDRSVMEGFKKFFLGFSGELLERLLGGCRE